MDDQDPSTDLMQSIAHRVVEEVRPRRSQPVSTYRLQLFREFTYHDGAAIIVPYLDIVPNHMSASVENPWWCDVVENGPVKQELTNKVLLPMLGQQYGKVLEDGQLLLEYNDGAFQIRYRVRKSDQCPATSLPRSHPCPSRLAEPS